jgi:hypothetical protein
MLSLLILALYEVTYLRQEYMKELSAISRKYTGLTGEKKSDIFFLHFITFPTGTENRELHFPLLNFSSSGMRQRHETATFLFYSSHLLGYHCVTFY